MSKYYPRRLFLGLLLLFFGYAVAFPQIIARTICYGGYGLCGLPVDWELVLALYLAEIIIFLVAYLWKEVTSAWRIFAFIYIPITFFFVMVAQDSYAGFGMSSPDREGIIWFSMQVFTLLSTIYFIFAGIKALKKVGFQPFSGMDSGVVFLGKTIMSVSVFLNIYFVFNKFPIYEGALNAIDVDDGFFSMLISTLACLLYLAVITFYISAVKRWRNWKMKNFASY